MANLGQISYSHGCWAEEVALKYLSDKNLKLLAKNFRSKFGEIDIIMQDKDTICFIEVRYRANEHFHTAAESISARKQNRIILTSHNYLNQNRYATHLDSRFDAVILFGKQECPVIEWIKDAFR